MGLDMYAFSVSKNEASEVEKEEIAYWRKFNALHGWMEDLYRSKGGDAESFNCIPVLLTKEDIMKLISDVSNNVLEPREGFFFGSQEIYPEDVESTIKFCGKALAEIAKGNEVYYDSWW